MITLPDPMPFADALDYLRDKQAVGSAMDTAAWREVPDAIRTKAFFSATLTSAQVARRMQDYIDDFLAQDRDVNDKGQEFFASQGRAEFVAKCRQMMIDEGFGHVLPDGSIDPEIHDNDLRDLRSCRRLQLIFDTQVEQANSYGQFLEGQDEDILDIWPCWKFVRVRPVMSPRPYHDAALGQIRRKDDLDFWLALNRDFNVPWGPWGFNSGCGTEDVDRTEAEAAGAIKPSDKVKPIIKDFNERLQQSVAGLGPDVRAWIKRQLGDMVTIHGDKAIYNKPEPSPVPRPDAVPAARPAKTPEQVRQQRQRIGDKIDQRQQRQAEQRAAVERAIISDFNTRRDAALSALKERMHTTLQQYREDKKISSWDAFSSASAAYHKASKSWSPGGMLYNAAIKNIAQQQAKIWTRTYRDSLRYLAVDGMLISRDKRGKIFTSSITFDNHFQASEDKPHKLTPNIRQGLDLIQSIVPADKLPHRLGVQIVKGSSVRAFHVEGNIKITDQHAPSVVAHEIAHAIEFRHPEILRKSAAFLYDRSNGDSAKPLVELVPSIKYLPTEIAFEDKWAERGGRTYTGKVYANNYYPSMSRDEFIDNVGASEILSMGIQRILETPAAFQKQDPDYFNFIKTQLHSL